MSKSRKEMARKENIGVKKKFFFFSLFWFLTEIAFSFTKRLYFAYKTIHKYKKYLSQKSMLWL